MPRKTRTRKHARREPRRFVVRSLRRDPPELTHFCQALLSLARAQREAQAQQTHEGKDQNDQ